MFDFLSPLTRRLFPFAAFAVVVFSAAPAQAQNAELSAASHHPPQAIVIGFMGGQVAPDDPTRNELIISDRLRAAFPANTYFEIYENRRVEEAHQKILQMLEAQPSARPTKKRNQETKIILYGHSWGASAVVTLADELQRDGIPVALTIQVDSIQKKGQHDALIPANVARAINFYQPDGLLHGRPEIRAADPTQTQILGNFKISYKEIPQECNPYPWYERKFIKTHIAIECDPALWNRIESLVRETIRESVTTAPALQTQTDQASHPAEPAAQTTLASGRRP
ncbi:MAG TPA: hypothetical protein VGD60_20270 [Candidatus Acidoferrales bacterium]